MIAVVSPAKSLDFEKASTSSFTLPRLLNQTDQLIEVLRKKEPKEVQELMNISSKLADLNVERYHRYETAHNRQNAKACVLAFQGDVYQGLKAESFDDGDMEFAQGHFRILSGLYGLLRPLDLIQPYRLEMGTKLAFDDYATLYDYWSRRILDLLIEDLGSQGDNIIVNLASKEYFKSIDKKAEEVRIVDVEFKDFKNGDYKIISFYAKKARGLMSRYMIQNRINDPEELKNFDYEGYAFDKDNSDENFLAFKRA